MALLKIESGEIIRQVGSRGAFALQETVTLPDGRTFPKTYTVWHEGDSFPNGAIVSVTGVFSAKTREYPAPSGMKTAIDISVNDPEVTLIHPGTTKDEGAPF